MSFDEVLKDTIPKHDKTRFLSPFISFIGSYFKVECFGTP
jgi:hypothetical protein